MKDQNLIDAEIKYPDLRASIVSTIKNLSDFEHQKKKWCSSKAAHRFWDAMSFDIENFEMTGLDTDEPEATIGYTIRNKEELSLVMNTMNRLWKVVDVIGVQKPDSEYVKSSLWKDVVKSATKAYNFIKTQGLDNLTISWIEKAHSNTSRVNCKTSTSAHKKSSKI